MNAQEGRPRQEAAAPQSNIDNPSMANPADNFQRVHGSALRSSSAAADGADRAPLSSALAAPTTFTAAPSPTAEQLARAMADVGITPDTARKLGWKWCTDSRGLPGVTGPAKARPYCGITGPRTVPGGPPGGGWFFLPVPPDADLGTVVCAPKVGLSLLPQRIRDGRPLNVCGDPVQGAQLYQSGERAGWVPGPRGWRALGGKPVPALADLGPADKVVLQISARDFADRVAARSWRALADALICRGVDVEAHTPEGEGGALFMLAEGRLPEPPKPRLESAAAKPTQDGFAAALDRASGKHGQGARFMSRNSLQAQDTVLAVQHCLPDLASGPGGLWAYDGRVWRPATTPDGGIIGQLAAILLGNDYRPAHESTVVQMLARIPGLTRLSGHPNDGWGEYLNFTNGLLHWPSGRLEEHRPSIRSTWALPMAYDPEATCLRLRQFLGQVLPADMTREVDGVAPWQEDLGYLLLPGNPLHTAFLLRGSGRNGKGVYLGVVMAMVGRDVASSLSLADMMDENRSRFRLVELVGSAVNVCSEIDPKYMSSTAVFKALVAGDPMTLEHKGKPPFSYTPWTTPLFSSNEDFAVVDHTEAFFSRLQVRSFPRFVLEGERNPNLLQEIVADELPGIAAAAVAGLRVVMPRGRFPAVESSDMQRRQFRSNADHIGRFLEDKVSLMEGKSCMRPYFHQRYKDWCDEEGHHAVNANRLLAALRDYTNQRGVQLSEYKVEGTWRVDGAALIPE